jgi:sporulation protein YlmC with PRC-barrel domain
MLAASMPLAMAQTAATTANPSPPPAAAATAQQRSMPNHVMSGQLRFADMNGATIYDNQNNDVGDINNVVLDRDGRVAAVVVKTGGFIGIGGKTVAVRMSDFKVTTDKNGKPRFTLDMTKNQLKSAQAYDLTPPKTAASGGSAPPVESRQK